VIRRRALQIGLAVVVCCAAFPAAAQYTAVYRSDAELDLAAAREAALEVVASDPLGADAVAAARWWADRLMDLVRPEEILDAPGPRRDPELSFLLARIAGIIDGQPPKGSFRRATTQGVVGHLGNRRSLWCLLESRPGA